MSIDFGHSTVNSHLLYLSILSVIPLVCPFDHDLLSFSLTPPTNSKRISGAYHPEILVDTNKTLVLSNLPKRAVDHIICVAVPK